MSRTMKLLLGFCVGGGLGIERGPRAAIILALIGLWVVWEFTSSTEKKNA